MIAATATVSGARLATSNQDDSVSPSAALPLGSREHHAQHPSRPRTAVGAVAGPDGIEPAGLRSVHRSWRHPARIPSCHASYRRPSASGDRPSRFSLRAPENTLPAFAWRSRRGRSGRVGLHHSRDGVPVVMHDGTLDLTTDATNRWGKVKIGVRRGQPPRSRRSKPDAGSPRSSRARTSQRSKMPWG